jgi:hypothetical protein
MQYQSKPMNLFTVEVNRSIGELTACKAMLRWSGEIPQKKTRWFKS